MDLLSTEVNEKDRVCPELDLSAAHYQKVWSQCNKSETPAFKRKSTELKTWRYKVCELNNTFYKLTNKKWNKNDVSQQMF